MLARTLQAKAVPWHHLDVGVIEVQLDFAVDTRVVVILSSAWIQWPTHENAGVNVLKRGRRATT